MRLLEASWQATSLPYHSSLLLGKEADLKGPIPKAVKRYTVLSISLTTTPIWITFEKADYSLFSIEFTSFFTHKALL